MLRSLGHGNSLHPQPVALMARQQPAFAAGCSHGTATGRIRIQLLSMQQACIRIQLLSCRSAMPGAALRPPGSIRAALLSLLPAPARIRTQLHLALADIWSGAWRCLSALWRQGGRQRRMLNAGVSSVLGGAHRYREYWSGNQPFTIQSTRFCCEVARSLLLHGKHP